MNRLSKVACCEASLISCMTYFKPSSSEAYSSRDHFFLFFLS